MGKIFGAFDFDHTIIKENSDLIARDLLPPDIIEKHLNTESGQGWTSYMNKTFELLSEEGVSISRLREAVISIEPVRDIVQLFRDLTSKNCEIIIISDSNTYFIEEWLKTHGLRGMVDTIYSNPASIFGNRLKIQEYHDQDWCKLSERNLCKGYVLLKHIEQRETEGITYCRKLYVGDGHNDLCPSLKLSENDFVFPRLGFPLSRKLSLFEGNIKAKIVPWENTSQIWSTVQHF